MQIRKLMVSSFKRRSDMIHARIQEVSSGGGGGGSRSIWHIKKR